MYNAENTLQLSLLYITAVNLVRISPCLIQFPIQYQQIHTYMQPFELTQFCFQGLRKRSNNSKQSSSPRQVSVNANALEKGNKIIICLYLRFFFPIFLFLLDRLIISQSSAYTYFCFVATHRSSTLHFTCLCSSHFIYVQCLFS